MVIAEYAMNPTNVQTTLSLNSDLTQNRMLFATVMSRIESVQNIRVFFNKSTLVMSLIESNCGYPLQP